MDPVGFGTAWGEIRGNSSSCNHNAPCSGAKSGGFFCNKKPMLTRICSNFCSTKMLLNKWQISKNKTCCNNFWRKGKIVFPVAFPPDYLKHPYIIKGCFTWMIPNLYMKNGWKSPNNCQTTCLLKCMFRVPVPRIVVSCFFFPRPTWVPISWILCSLGGTKFVHFAGQDVGLSIWSPKTYT